MPKQLDPAEIFPRGSHLLIKVPEEPEETESGLVIPEVAREHYTALQAEIVARGPDVQEPSLQPGMHVIQTSVYRRYGSSLLPPGYFFVNEEDIIALIEE